MTQVCGSQSPSAGKSKCAQDHKNGRTGSPPFSRFKLDNTPDSKQLDNLPRWPGLQEAVLLHAIYSVEPRCQDALGIGAE